MKKDLLRQKAIEIRSAMSADQRSKFSKQIFDHVKQFCVIEKLTSVMIYLSMKSEVGTWQIAKFLLDREKNVIAPTIISDRLEPFRIRNLDGDLIKHRFGMSEPHPKICPKFPPDRIDLIFVPGVCFDLNGYRIGYGGGFYDRFLPKCRNALRIGLAFGSQIVDDIFPEDYDIPMDRIVTEQKVLKIEK